MLMWQIQDQQYFQWLETNAVLLQKAPNLPVWNIVSTNDWQIPFFCYMDSLNCCPLGWLSPGVIYPLNQPKIVRDFPQ